MVTTTASIGAPKLRCACGRESWGGVAVISDGGPRAVALCCATGSARAELVRLIPDLSVLPADPVPALLGVDPLGRFADVHPSAMLKVQGHEQSLRKAPALPAGQCEVLEESVDSAVPEYVGSRSRPVPVVGPVIHAPAPAYGDSGPQLKGMSYRRSY